MKIDQSPLLNSNFRSRIQELFSQSTEETRARIEAEQERDELRIRCVKLENGDRGGDFADDDLILKLKEEIADIRDQRDSALASAAQAQKQLASQKTLNRKSSNMELDLQSQVGKMKDEQIGILQNQVSVVQKENQEYVEEIHALQEEVHMLQAEKDDLTRDYEREQTAAQVVRHEKEMLKADIVKQTPAVVQLRLENSKQKEEIAKLKIEIEQKSAQIDSQSDRIDHQNLEITRLENRTLHLRRSSSQLLRGLRSGTSDAESDTDGPSDTEGAKPSGTIAPRGALEEALEQRDKALEKYHENLQEKYVLEDRLNDICTQLAEEKHDAQVNRKDLLIQTALAESTLKENEALRSTMDRFGARVPGSKAVMSYCLSMENRIQSLCAEKDKALQRSEHLQNLLNASLEKLNSVADSSRVGQMEAERVMRAKEQERRCFEQSFALLSELTQGEDDVMARGSKGRASAEKLMDSVKGALRLPEVRNRFLKISDYFWLYRGHLQFRYIQYVGMGGSRN